jgi:hypothetical protein
MEDLINIIWTSNTAAGVLSIVGVALASAAATLLAFYHAWRYAVAEAGSLNRVKASLQRWQKERGGDGRELAKLDELKKTAPAGSLIHLRVLSIERMRATNVKVDFEALQQITFAAEAGKPGLRAPGFAVGFVLLLGLLGSAVSLCLALSQSGRTAAAAGTGLGPMIAPFTCGVAGLLGSLWLSLCSFGLGIFQARFFEKFERFTVEELLPLTVPDIRNEAWLRQMQYKIGESFERIKEIAEQNHQTVKDFETVAAGFSRLIDGLEQSARKGASADVQKVIGQLGQVIGQVSRANDSVLELTGRVPEALKSAQAQNQLVLSRLDSLTQKTGEQSDRLLNVLTTSQNGLPQALDGLQRSQQAVVQRVEQALGAGRGPALSAQWAASPPALKLVLYSVPPMFVLILLVLLVR